jgi:hypothetical protein
MIACIKVNERILVPYLQQFPNSGRYSAHILQSLLVMTTAYGLICKDHQKTYIKAISGKFILQFNYVSHFYEAKFTTLHPNKLVFFVVLRSTPGRDTGISSQNYRDLLQSLQTKAMAVFQLGHDRLFPYYFQFTYPTIHDAYTTGDCSRQNFTV